ncbi:MAG: aminotransferase class V-fold PLP-dependent enzyme [Bacillota bacterium]
MEWQMLRAEFPALVDGNYLNTGGGGLVPAGVARAAGERLARYYSLEMPVHQRDLAMRQEFEAARATVAQVLGTSLERVAFSESTADATKAVLYNLGWQTGDKVAYLSSEHFALTIQLRFLARLYGLELVEIPNEVGAVAPEQVARYLTPTVRLLCVSHVAYATGALQPIAEIVAVAHRLGVPVLVDGAQGLGATAFSVEQSGCDFYTFPGQKWLLGPEGVGGIYVSASGQELLRPRVIGIPSCRSFKMDGQYELHTNARLLELNKVNPVHYTALADSIRWVNSIGRDWTLRRIVELCQRLQDGLREIPGVRVITPRSTAESAGLVCAYLDWPEGEKLATVLWEQEKIAIRQYRSPVGFRVSPHFYNNEDDVDHFLRAMRRLAPGTGN